MAKLKEYTSAQIDTQVSGLLSSASNDYANYAEKTSVSPNDRLILESSADSNAQRSVLVGEALVRVDHSIVDKTSDYTLTSGDCNGFKTFTNTGAAGAIKFTLPTASAGLQVDLVNTAGQILTVDPGSATLATFSGMTSSAGGVDDYTKLMLHMDDTGLTDTTGKTVTKNGDVARSSAFSKFGGYSAVFDGTGDYLSVPTSTDWDFGTGDFAIDFWVKASANPVGDRSTLVARASNGSWAGINWVCMLETNGKIMGQASNNGGTGITLVSTSAVTNDAWHHVAFVRNGNRFDLYIDGTSEANTTSAITILSNSTTVGVGYCGYTTVYFTGYLDEVRVSKGAARWTGNFSVPTSAYTRSTLSNSTAGSSLSLTAVSSSAWVSVNDKGVWA